jgi:hypothetical protein
MHHVTNPSDLCWNPIGKSCHASGCSHFTKTRWLLSIVLNNMCHTPLARDGVWCLSYRPHGRIFTYVMYTLVGCGSFTLASATKLFKKKNDKLQLVAKLSSHIMCKYIYIYIYTSLCFLVVSRHGYVLWK